MTSVLIIGDSSFVRLLLRKRLALYDDIDVIADIPNNNMCVDIIKNAKPQTILVDIDNPTVTGLNSIRYILQNVPSCTIIVLMNLSVGGAEIALKALEYGAVDFIHKESSLHNIDINTFANALYAKILQWSISDNYRTRTAKDYLTFSKQTTTPVPSIQQAKLTITAKKPKKPIDLVLIGISTGGPLTLLSVLSNVPKLKCPMIIAQHMPQAFTKSLSIHLQNETKLNVVEGSHALPLEPGMVVIARGGTDSRVQKVSNNKLMLIEKIDPSLSIHPSVDVLYSSASALDCETLAIVMTGMGRDGLEGAKKLHEKNMTIIAQDLNTCIVNGMPSAVIEAHLAKYVLAPEKIGELIAQWCGE